MLDEAGAPSYTICIPLPTYSTRVMGHMNSSSAPWVEGKTIAQALAHTAGTHPSEDALVFPQLGYRRTYAQFHRDVREAARALLGLGLGPGVHVGIWATNWPEWVILQYAVAHIGCTLVNGLTEASPVIGPNNLSPRHGCTHIPLRLTRTKAFHRISS